jgi:hypothetical protein
MPVRHDKKIDRHRLGATFANNIETTIDNRGIVLALAMRFRRPMPVERLIRMDALVEHRNVISATFSNR